MDTDNIQNNLKIPNENVFYEYSKFSSIIIDTALKHI